MEKYVIEYDSKFQNYDLSENVVIKYGERTSAYDSDPDQIIKKHRYSGSLSDCYAYIMLKENNNIDF